MALGITGTTVRLSLKNMNQPVRTSHLVTFSYVTECCVTGNEVLEITSLNKKPDNSLVQNLKVLIKEITLQ
jgi:hypothetical protein